LPYVYILCELANSIITDKCIWYNVLTDLHDNVTEVVYIDTFTVKDDNEPSIKYIMINELSNKSCLI